MTVKRVSDTHKDTVQSINYCHLPSKATLEGVECVRDNIFSLEGVWVEGNESVDDPL
jgi:hypothetical protein